MLILNFSHPLSGEQQGQIEALTRTTLDEVCNIPIQISGQESLETQIRAIVNAIQLTSEQWQTLPLLINPPGYAPAAIVLLAELHGRIGHFPSMLSLRSTAGVVASYEVAGIVNLQTIRETSRTYR
jgi:hypothetical protein